MSHNNTQAIALQPPNTPYLIQPVAIKHLIALQEVCWQDRTLDKSRMYLKHIISAFQRKRGLGVVVMDGERLIGYGQAFTLTKCSEISDLFVHADYRSQGIGTAIIQTLCREMTQQSQLPIEIGVALSNTRALTLYERLGFKEQYHRELNLGYGVETVRYLALTHE